MMNTAPILKEHISHALNTMSLDELVIIYEQIHLLEHLKHLRSSSVDSLPIETIRKMTSVSKNSWSETVIREREERG